MIHLILLPFMAMKIDMKQELKKAAADRPHLLNEDKR